MEVVWEADRPVSVRQVLEQIAQSQAEHLPAYTTVMTVLDRLHDKGWVTRAPAGRAYVYRPRQSREEHVADVMSQALDGSGDRTMALEHFAAALPATDLAALRRALTGRRGPR